MLEMSYPVSSLVFLSLSFLSFLFFFGTVPVNMNTIAASMSWARCITLEQLMLMVLNPHFLSLDLLSSFSLFFLLPFSFLLFLYLRQHLYTPRIIIDGTRFLTLLSLFSPSLFSLLFLFLYYFLCSPLTPSPPSSLPPPSLLPPPSSLLPPPSSLLPPPSSLLPPPSSLLPPPSSLLTLFAVDTMESWQAHCPEMVNPERFGNEVHHTFSEEFQDKSS